MAGAARREAACAGLAASNWIALSTFAFVSSHWSDCSASWSSTRGRGWRPSGRRFSRSRGSGGVPYDWTRCGTARSRADVGESGRAELVVTGPARPTPWAVRVQAEIEASAESICADGSALTLPWSRSPPRAPSWRRSSGWPSRESQTAPEASTNVPGSRARGSSFSAGAAWRQLGSRGGIAGGGDRLRNRIERAIRRGSDESAVRWFSGSSSARTKDCLKTSSRTFGHLASRISWRSPGQNVAYIAIGIFGLGWLLRIRESSGSS